MYRLMRQNILLLLLMVVIALSGSTGAGAACQSAEAKSGSAAISETDTYVDLNTKKTFRIMYDELNDKYERDDLFAFDLYVNTRTQDTFWLEAALLVNNALVRDAAGNFKVDPAKVKRDGSGYKVINSKAATKPDDVAEKAAPHQQGAASTM
jgi:hypothetical protein